MAEPGRPGGLSGGQRLAVGVSVMLGLGLAAYGVAGSYNTVSILAERKAFRWRGWCRSVSTAV